MERALLAIGIAAGATALALIVAVTWGDPYWLAEMRAQFPWFRRLELFAEWARIVLIVGGFAVFFTVAFARGGNRHRGW